MDKNRFSLLIVDDDKNLLNIYTFLFKKNGYNILTATDGQKAIEICEEKKPDLVLLDINLPLINGIDVMKHLKASPQTNKIFVVLITALQSSTEDISSAFHEGADGYLLKPVDNFELLSRVESYFRHIETLRELEDSKERYKVLIDDIPDFILRWKKNGEIKFINPVFKLFYNYDIPDISFDIIGLDNSKHIINTLEENNSDSQVIVQQLIHKNGEEVWIEWSNKAIRTDGILSEIHSIGRDISRRVEAENDFEKAFEMSKRGEIEQKLLLKASEAVLRNLSFQKAARIIFDTAKEATGAKAGYIALLSKDGSENEVLFLDDGGENCTVDPELPMPIRGLRSISYFEKRVALDNNFAVSKWQKYMPEGHVPLHNVMFAPLEIDENVVGIMGLANKVSDFDEHDQELAKMFGDIAAISLKLSRFFDVIKENEARYRQMVNAIISGVMIIEVENNGNEIGLYKVKELNNSAILILGSVAENYLGESVEKTLNFFKKQEYFDNLRNCWLTGAPQFFSLRNEDDIFLDCKIFKLPNSEIIVVFDDITERKLSEIAIKEKNTFLQNLIDTIPDPIFYKDINGAYQIVNNAFCEFIGLERNKLIGKNAAQISPKDNASVYSEMDQLIYNTRLKQTYESKVQTFYNESKEVIFHKAPYFNHKAEIVGIVGMIIDISEQKKMENELVQKMNELEKLNKFMVGRENRMIQLKKEINELNKQLGLERKYNISSID